MTIKVWVLIMFFKSGYGGGASTIDDIASETECNSVKARIDARMASLAQSTCVQVEKVLP